MSEEENEGFQAEFDITDVGEIEESHEEPPQEAAEESVEETPEETTEEAPEAEEEQPTEAEKVVFTEEQQRVFNEQISRKVKKQREAEREAEQLRQQLAEAQQKLNPEPVRPDVPPLPDPYDPDYTAKIQERDRKIQERAEFDAIAHERQRYAEAIELQKQKQAQEEHQKKLESYAERATNLGHELDAVVESTKYLIDSGLNQEAQAYIRDDKNGPDIAMYLAKNPTALSDLLDMQQVQPHMSFAKLVTEVREKATSTARPKPKLPPDPPTHLSGKGAPEGNENPHGARFE